VNYQRGTFLSLMVEEQKESDQYRWLNEILVTSL